MNHTSTVSTPTLIASTAAGSIVGSVVGPLLIAAFRVIAERIIPYIRSGAFKHAVTRIIEGTVHPMREILPGDLPHDVYEGIVELSKCIYRRSNSSRDIADGCEYTTLGYIYRIRLQQKGEVLTSTCVRTTIKSPPKVHEFHSKVIQELRSPSDQACKETAKLLSTWIAEGKANDYSCGSTMMYEIIGPTKSVIIEVIENPVLDGY